VIGRIEVAPGQDAREWSDICWAWSKKILGKLDSRPSAAIPANQPAKITPGQYFVVRSDDQVHFPCKATEITIGCGFEFAGHDLDSSLIALPIIQQPHHNRPRFLN